MSRLRRCPIVCALLLAGCGVLTPDGPPEDQLLDGTVEGITPSQVRQHIAGDEEFGRRFSAAGGLGPIFVATSCEQCHVGDGKGHPTFMLFLFGQSGVSDLRLPIWRP